MSQVNAKQQVGENIKSSDRPSIKTAHNILINLFAHKLALGADRVDNTKCQIKKMPNQKTKHDHAAIAHRATRKVCNFIIAWRLILHGSRLTVHDCKRPCGVQVQREHCQQAASKNPQHGALWRKRIQKLFQKFGVMIQFVRAEIHLQIADHVKQHETH